MAVFGNGILQENGEVDRAKLGEIVFSDAAKRKQLNRFVFSFCYFFPLNLQPSHYIRECSKFKDPVSFKASCFGHAKEFPILMPILID